MRGITTLITKAKECIPCSRYIHDKLYHKMVLKTGSSVTHPYVRSPNNIFLAKLIKPWNVIEHSLLHVTTQFHHCQIKSYSSDALTNGLPYVLLGTSKHNKCDSELKGSLYTFRALWAGVSCQNKNWRQMRVLGMTTSNLGVNHQAERREGQYTNQK